MHYVPQCPVHLNALCAMYLFALCTLTHYIPYFTMYLNEVCAISRYVCTYLSIYPKQKKRRQADSSGG